MFAPHWMSRDSITVDRNETVPDAHARPNSTQSRRMPGVDIHGNPAGTAAESDISNAFLRIVVLRHRMLGTPSEPGRTSGVQNSRNSREWNDVAMLQTQATGVGKFLLPPKS
jgi:CBS-domain-containing membrane protein